MGVQSLWAATRPVAIFHFPFVICYFLRIRPPPIDDPMIESRQMINVKWKMAMENSENDKWNMGRVE